MSVHVVEITIIEHCFKGRIEITSKKFTLVMFLILCYSQSESKKRTHQEMETGVLVDEKKVIDEKNYTDYDV